MQEYDVSRQLGKGALILCTLLIPFCSQSRGAEGQPQLRERLTAAVARESSRAQDTGALARITTEYLKETQSAPSDEDKVFIYSDLVRLYVNDGMRQPEKVAEYASKALEVAVLPADKCRLYIAQGDALERLRKSSGAVGRRADSLHSYLSALEIIRSNQRSDSIRELPNIDWFDGPANTNDPIFQAMDRRYREQVAARSEVDQQNALIRSKGQLLARIALLYPADATKELETDAMEYLGDSERVKQLLSAVRPSTNSP